MTPMLADGSNVAVGSAPAPSARTQILDPGERESDAVVLAELIVNTRVGQGVLPDQALPVHKREVIALRERLQRALQDTSAENSRSV